MVKLTEVAEKAGVSLATASLVFSRQGRLKESTRQRVLDAATSLGYRMRRRNTGKAKPGDIGTELIGVLFDIDPEWSMTLYLIRPLIASFQNTMRSAGYESILVPISRDDSIEVMMNKIIASGATSIVSIHFISPELILLLEASDIPVVVVMNSSYQDRFYTVCVDDYQGAYEATQFLLRNGHSNIAYIDCVRPGLPILSVDRFFGYKNALDENGHSYRDELKCQLTCSNEADDLKKLASVNFKARGITACFILDDELGAWVASLLVRLGLSIPQDVSIIATGDMLNYSHPWVPQLSTMRIDTEHMGVVTAQMLIGRIVHNPANHQVLKVKQHLFNRESVRNLGGTDDVT